MESKIHIVAISTACFFLLPFMGHTQTGNEHFRWAVLKDAANDFAGVVNECDAALAANDCNANAYYLRGKARYRLGDYYGAMDDETRAIALGLQNEEVYLIRGTVAGASGDYKKAIRDFSKAIKINPGDWQVYYLRGLANNKLAYRKKARLDFRQAVLLGMKESADLNAELTEPD
jgi:serine/threonine-protein kinase